MFSADYYVKEIQKCVTTVLFWYRVHVIQLTMTMIVTFDQYRNLY